MGNPTSIFVSFLFPATLGFQVPPDVRSGASRRHARDRFLAADRLMSSREDRAVWCSLRGARGRRYGSFQDLDARAVPRPDRPVTQGWVILGWN